MTAVVPSKRVKFVATRIVRKLGLVAVGLTGEKDGALVSLENVLRYWRAFTSNSDEVTVLPVFAFVPAVCWYAINPFRPRNT